MFKIADIQITKLPNRKILVNDIEIPDVMDISIYTDVTGQTIDTIQIEIKVDSLKMELI